MKIVFKTVSVSLLALTVRSCELLSPKFWAEAGREDKMMGRFRRHTGEYINFRPHCLYDSDNKMLECSSQPYKDKKFLYCTGRTEYAGELCRYRN